MPLSIFAKTKFSHPDFREFSPFYVWENFDPLFCINFAQFNKEIFTKNSLKYRKTLFYRTLKKRDYQRSIPFSFTSIIPPVIPPAVPPSPLSLPLCPSSILSILFSTFHSHSFSLPPSLLPTILLLLASPLATLSPLPSLSFSFPFPFSLFSLLLLSGPSSLPTASFSPPSPAAILSQTTPSLRHAPRDKYGLPSVPFSLYPPRIKEYPFKSAVHIWFTKCNVRVTPVQVMLDKK